MQFLVGMGTLIAGCGEVRSGALFGNPDASVCPDGEERCACYGNHTCNGGLTCASGLCVVISGSGGATGRSTGASFGGSTQDAGSDGGAESGGARGSGGARVGSGGAPAAGGRIAAAGRNGGGGTGGLVSSSGGTTVTSGGSSSGGSVCGTGLKFCGSCTQPTPNTGCSLTGCQPCPLQAPENGYVLCVSGRCEFDCLSGYLKNGDKCENGTVGGGGDAGNCQPSSCPNCGTVLGPGCCTPAGTCGCPLIPFVSTACG